MKDETLRDRKLQSDLWLTDIHKGGGKYEGRRVI